MTPVEVVRSLLRDNMLERSAATLSIVSLNRIDIAGVYEALTCYLVDYVYLMLYVNKLKAIESRFTYDCLVAWFLIWRLARVNIDGLDQYCRGR